MKYIYRILFLITAFTWILAGVSHAADNAEMTSFRWTSRNDGDPPFVRIVVDLTASVKAEASMEDSGQRLSLLLKNTQKGRDLYDEYKMDPRGAGIATVSSSGNDTILNIALSQKQSIKDIKIFPLKPDTSADKTHRLVIDIPIPGAKKSYWKSVEDMSPPPSKTYDVTKKAKEILNGKVICIDPGHGGTDTGAIAQLNDKDIYEKDINMSIAIPLRDMLASAGAKVIMTRSADTDVYGPWSDGSKELQARCDVANKARADAFISIHIDAFSNPDIDGTTAYYAPKSKQDALLAKELHDSLMQSMAFPDRGVRANDFYVNVHTDMPSVLMELGYMSNPHRLQMLTSKWAPKSIAHALFNGFISYFENIR